MSRRNEAREAEPGEKGSGEEDGFASKSNRKPTANFKQVE